MARSKSFTVDFGNLPALLPSGLTGSRSRSLQGFFRGMLQAPAHVESWRPEAVRNLPSWGYLKCSCLCTSRATTSLVTSPSKHPQAGAALLFWVAAFSPSVDCFNLVAKPCAPRLTGNLWFLLWPGGRIVMGKSSIFLCSNMFKWWKNGKKNWINIWTKLCHACAQSSTGPLTKGDQLAILHQHLAVQINMARYDYVHGEICDVYCGFGI